MNGSWGNGKPELGGSGVASSRSLEVVGEACDLTLAVDTGDLASAGDDQILVTADFVFVMNSHTPRADDFGGHDEQVIEFRWEKVLDFHLGDDQEEPTGLEFAIGVAGGPEHFDPPPLEEVKILRVVDAALSVGFVVTDSNFHGKLGVHTRNWQPF